jgi:hypothetical protein
MPALRTAPLAWTRNGRPIWPIAGGSDDPAPAADPQPASPPAPDTEPAGTPPTQPELTPPDTGGQPATQPTDTTDWKAEAEKFRALSKKHEARAKENATAAQELQKLKDAEKSELQRLHEAAEQSQKRAQDAELRALRMEVAAEKGLTSAQARRLVGSTKDELLEDADDLLSSFQPAKQDPAPPEPPAPAPDQKPQPSNNGGGDRTRRPTERLTPGAAPDAEPDEDPAAIAAELSRGY